MLISIIITMIIIVIIIIIIIIIIRIIIVTIIITIIIRIIITITIITIILLIQYPIEYHKTTYGKNRAKQIPNTKKDHVPTRDVFSAFVLRLSEHQSPHHIDRVFY